MSGFRPINNDLVLLVLNDGSHVLVDLDLVFRSDERLPSFDGEDSVDIDLGVYVLATHIPSISVCVGLEPPRNDARRLSGRLVFAARQDDSPARGELSMSLRAHAIDRRPLRGPVASVLSRFYR
jgi:hypothetical protein